VEFAACAWFKAANNAMLAIIDNLGLNSISGNLRAQDGGSKALVKFVSAARRGPGIRDRRRPGSPELVDRR